MELDSSLESRLGRQGVSATLQSLRTKDAEAMIDAAAKERRWLIVADDPGYETKSLVSLVDRMLTKNKDSKALFIARDVPSDLSVEAEFRFKSEFILERSILGRRTRKCASHASPQLPVAAAASKRHGFNRRDVVA
jgi:hypothetical protein